MMPRYGKKIRDKRKEIKKRTSKRYHCAACNRKSIKRKASGIWVCSKCNTKYASGAYTFKGGK